MVARELEDVGVHHEQQYVAGELHLELEVAAVGEFEYHLFAFLLAACAEEFDELASLCAEEFEGLLGGIEYVLFQLTLGEDEVFQ